MAALEQPRYIESYQDYETPSYGSSMQQLQNLPPPVSEEPSLLDAPMHMGNNYDLPTQGSILMDPIETAPPSYEQSTILEEPSFPTLNSHVYNKPEDQTNYSGYPPVAEMDDKIKDIMGRYNPHEIIPENKANNHIFEAPSPPQTQPNVRPPTVIQQTYVRPIEAPKNTNPSILQNNRFNNNTPISYPAQPVITPQQNQMRARVVQNVPATTVVNNPRMQNPTIQIPTVQSPPVQAVHAHNIVPPNTNQMYANNTQDSAYLQLMQHQTIQFQLQNQQIQNINHSHNQQSKEMMNQMQNYFEKITSFMERVDRRLNNLEQTANTILRNQRGDQGESFGLPPKNELESLKKVQEQMESDMDMAKRLQREMDDKFAKEKKKEEKEKKRAQEKKDRESKPSPSLSSSSSTPSGMQECPICTLRVPFADLELHVNQCLENIEGNNSSSTSTPKDSNAQEKASFWKRVFGPGPKKDEKDKNTPPARPALPAPPTPNPTAPGTYPPNGQEFYPMPQMPFVYRGGYPQPQLVGPQMYPYPGQQVYYIPSGGMNQPGNQTGKK